MFGDSCEMSVDIGLKEGDMDALHRITKDVGRERRGQGDMWTDGYVSRIPRSHTLAGELDSVPMTWNSEEGML